MISNRTYVVLTLIGQSAGSREYFHDTDHAEEEEHHPDDFIALEDIAYFLVHFIFFFRLS